MTYKITLIPGDGIGPEVSNAARRCVDATGVKVEWEVVEAGADVIAKYGTPLPQSTLDSIKKNKIALKGPLTTPIGTGFRSVNVAIRKELDLYTCLRPCKSFKGVRSKYQNIDLVVVRENTEDLYAGIEFEEGKQETKNLISEIEKLSQKKIRPDSGISIKPISISGTKRIVEFAFENEAAKRLENAVAYVIAEGTNVTYDLKTDRNDPTSVGTSQMADAIIEKLAEVNNRGIKEE